MVRFFYEACRYLGKQCRSSGSAVCIWDNYRSIISEAEASEIDGYAAMPINRAKLRRSNTFKSKETMPTGSE